MEARELRIGNLLTCESGIREVCRIDVDGCVTSQVGEAMKYDGRPTTLEPIPLTEEWLERFGLKSHDLDSIKNPYLENVVGKYRGEDKFEFVISSGDDYYGGWSYNTIEIKYFHQLQNLYFALTGEELELK
jgi:hypothetical protein